jgi:hypothetical protein
MCNPLMPLKFPLGKNKRALAAENPATEKAPDAQKVGVEIYPFKKYR